MKCPRCQSKTTLAHDVLDEAPYEYHRCTKCGEEVLDMKQLGELGERHKEIRKAREAKFATWGNSIGIRIPKEMTDKLKIANGTPARISIEKGGIRIVKA